MDNLKFIMRRLPFLIILMFVLSNFNLMAFAEGEAVIKANPDQKKPELEPTMAEYQEWLKKNGQKKKIIPPLPTKIMKSPPVQNPRRVLSRQEELVIPATPEDFFDDAPVIETPPIPFKQSRDVMINSAPPYPAPSAESKEAFNVMMQQNVPLTPQQVVKLRQLIDTSQRAAAIPANIPPKPVSSTLMVNLAPGATPPAIRLAQGYITSLVFVDSTGSPWPIASYDIGDPRKITPQWDGKSNILLMQAVSPYGDSDLIIRLVGLPTPITLQLVAGQRVVDYRTDIHVSGLGPNSKDIPTGVGLPGNANQLLLSVLDGVPPSGSKQLKVTGGDCLAWLLGDKMYLRTRFTVLSPGWIGTMVSPDGMHAYEIQQSSSVLISQYGSPVELKIEGF